jgi:hypothetical protein
MSSSRISEDLRRVVAEKSQNRCSYCQCQQDIVGTMLTVDHIVPESLGGTTTEDNLCLACWDCNLIKGSRTSAVDPQTGEPVRLFHPNQQKWQVHFDWNESGTHILGKTPIGRATILILKLNRPTLILSRQYWVQAGWHPPQ